jgi:hypothetical protein
MVLLIHHGILGQRQLLWLKTPVFPIGFFDPCGMVLFDKIQQGLSWDYHDDLTTNHYKCWASPTETLGKW